jgi:VWFA-related protein
MGVQRSAWIVGFGLTLSFGSALFGQTDSNVLTLNISATDGHDKPVSGLKAEDFQILDNGKPRKVVSFDVLPANGTAKSTLFILLDLFNADLAARGYTENEMVKGLQHQESVDNVYVYLLTSAGTIYPVRAVGSPAGDKPWTEQIKSVLDAALGKVNALKSQDDRYEVLRIQPTWQALFNLTNEIQKVPGPKSFLWVTQGIENGFMQPGREMVINTTPLRVFAARLSSLEGVAFSVQERPNGSLATDNTGSPGDTLRQLAELTGGRAYASDTTEKAIAEAINNPPRLNYRLTFAPDKLDGKYHKLKVTSANKDVKVQSPLSYYASPLPSGAN